MQAIDVKAEIQGPDLRTSVWYGLLLLLSLFLLRLAFALPGGPGQAALALLLYASGALFFALLLAPPATGQGWTRFAHNGRSALIAVIVLLLAAILDPVTREVIDKLLPATVTLFLLVFAGLTAAGMATGTVEARAAVFMLFAVLFASPLWLAPFAELANGWSAPPNAIVGISPLSALSVSLDIDYLRTPWFYRNSPLGSLRYDYPSWLTYLTLLGALSATLTVWALRTERRRRNEYTRSN